MEQENLEKDGGMLEKKKEMKLKQLSSRDENRINVAASKKEEKLKEKVQSEQNDFFVENFYGEVSAIKMLIKCEGVDKDKTSMTKHFNDVSQKFEKLRKFLNDSIMYLNGYELSKAQNALKDLQSLISTRRDEMIPKKKFAFKTKKSNNTEKPTAAPAQVKKESQMIKLSDFDIRDKTNENLSLNDNDINQKDIALANLTSCRVELRGYPGTIHITDLSNCTVLCGPVSGSVFVDRCVNTKLVSGCQQLRVHNTKEVDFYLHVTSRAIIEDTTQVRFAPYNWQYPELDEHFKKSGLDKSSNNYNHVDDFNWLALDTASPNWSILPESERVHEW